MSCIDYNCKECGNIWFKPRDSCPECGSKEIFEVYDEEFESQGDEE